MVINGPHRISTEGSVGVDVYAQHDGWLFPFFTKAFETGITLDLPPDIWASIEGRSSLSLDGIIPAHGVIDPDYRGQVKIVLLNHTWKPYFVQKGDRIAQLVFHKVLLPPLSRRDEAIRETKGFGSTGR